MAGQGEEDQLTTPSKLPETRSRWHSEPTGKSMKPGGREASGKSDALELPRYARSGMPRGILRSYSGLPKASLAPPDLPKADCASGALGIVPATQRSTACSLGESPENLTALAPSIEPIRARSLTCRSTSCSKCNVPSTTALGPMTIFGLRFELRPNQLTSISRRVTATLDLSPRRPRCRRWSSRCHRRPWPLRATSCRSRWRAVRPPRRCAPVSGIH